MPSVSALMVFHRDTPFLRPAIASMLGQTYRDLEFVLVDNGVGLSAEALGPAGADPRLRWVRLEGNTGIARGHNAGLAVAQGEFVALLDSDDLAEPQRLERQVTWLRRAPEVGLVASLAHAIDAEGRDLGLQFALLDSEDQRRYTQYASPFFTPSWTGRRELFEALPYRPGFVVGADYDFVSRAAERSRLAAVPEVLIRYRHHPSQTTVERAAIFLAELCAVRLMTARRRAGRPEGDDLIPVQPDRATPAEICRDYAHRCAAEGFPALAAYHARRSFAEARTVGAGLMALRIFLRGLRGASLAERRHATRMFLTGPVRALGVRPV